MTDQAAEKTSSVRIPIVPAQDFTIVKTVTGVAPGDANNFDAANDIGSYQIVVTNTGNQDLTTSVGQISRRLSLQRLLGCVLCDRCKQLRPVDRLGLVSVTTCFPAFLIITGHGIRR